jgi:phosphotransferase system HPr (HPr) family protein
MVEAQVTISLESGLHARPAAQLVKAANGFQSQIQICYQEKTVNAKSMLEVMRIAVPQGETVVFKVSGPDETAALQQMVNQVSGAPK